ncbi:Flavin adenine dinucleotide synthase [Intoshia linei]|uniref:FAD synthase n=1 Tax=Intoshia linei TaxID=1819745 RepID=A0A177AZF0_9BILA|nr:Flavin adenine dinucleotide synthase [Intoshia linei]
MLEDIIWQNKVTSCNCVLKIIIRLFESTERQFYNLLFEFRNTIYFACSSNEPSSNEISIAFNGGKDCTIVLDIFYKIFKEKYPSEKIITIFITNKGVIFDEIMEIINFYTQKCNLNLVQIESDSQKDALFTFKKKFPTVKHILMGNRYTDPNCSKLTHLSETSEDWPEYIRVLPILNWNYSDVWTYILQKNIKYCELYNKGYTSIGLNERDTQINQLLINKSDSVSSFLAAYRLSNDKFERNGRKF